MRKENQDCPCHGKTLTRFVQPIILSILSEAPCHGYVIMQKIARTKLWDQLMPDPAGIYRTLRDMEKRGLVTSRLDQEGGGIGRRIFTITEEGLGCRRSWLSTLHQYQQGSSEVISMLEQEGGWEEDGDGPACSCLEQA